MAPPEQGYDPGAVPRGAFCAQCPEIMRQVATTDARVRQIEKVNDRDHQEIKDAQRELFGLVRDMPAQLATMIPKHRKEPMLGLTGKQFIVVLALLIVLVYGPKVLTVLTKIL